MKETDSNQETKAFLFEIESFTPCFIYSLRIFELRIPLTYAIAKVLEELVCPEIVDQNVAIRAW